MKPYDAITKLLGTAWDSALPQPWLDQWANVLEGRFTYHEILGSFVWAYDEPYRLCGRPYPITRLGNEILAAINCHGDTRYPLTEHPIDEPVPAVGFFFEDFPFCFPCVRQATEPMKGFMIFADHPTSLYCTNCGTLILEKEEI